MLEQQAAQVGAQGIMGSDHTYVMPGAAGEPRRAGAAARKRCALPRCPVLSCVGPYPVISNTWLLRAKTVSGLEEQFCATHGRMWPPVCLVLGTRWLLSRSCCLLDCVLLIEKGGLDRESVIGCTPAVFKASGSAHAGAAC